MDRAAKLASEAARGRDAAMAVQQRRKAPLPEEAAAGSSKRLMQAASAAKVAREAAAKKTGRVAAPEIPASLPLSSRPPKSGKQLWRKAGMGLVLGLKAFKKDAAVEPRAPTPKAQRQASAGLAAGVSSASPRNSRQQRRADVAARERRAASPREERRAAPPRPRRGRCRAARAQRVRPAAVGPRRGGAEEPSPSSRRLTAKKQRLAKYSVVGRTSVFLNHERDYMVCVTERHAARLHAPVLFKERDLRAGGDVREPAALPPFARHYLFKCGRLTMRGRGDDAGADVSILGVDTFSLGDAVASGNYVDAASFGDYEARALEGWTPEHEAGDELHDSYAAALHEAEDAARRGVHLNAEAHAVIARNHEAARRDSLALAEAHARDSALLADLVDGYAPGQLGAKRDAAYDPRAADAALPPPQATAPRGSAKGAKVAATHSRVL
ncbi:hypothetical protein JL722_1620 [Aureococcus anophagefferens]|nr:hypothetical protein JL722_1620 [Aureococcus anophagefferens]